MAPGFTVGFDLSMSEHSFEKIIGIGLMFSFVLALAAGIKLWTGAARPQEVGGIAKERQDENTEKEENVNSEGNGVHDWIHVGAKPQEKEEPQEPKIPEWAQVGAKPPQSFDDLVRTTPEPLLRCRIRTACLHNRLNKKGSNASMARINCTDCGLTLAQAPRV